MMLLPRRRLLHRHGLAIPPRGQGVTRMDQSNSKRPRRNNCKRKRGYFYVLEFGQPCRPLEAVLKVDGDERLRAVARKVKTAVQVDGRTVLTHDVKSSSRLELTVGERKHKATDGPEPVTKHRIPLRHHRLHLMLESDQLHVAQNA